MISQLIIALLVFSTPNVFELDESIFLTHTGHVQFKSDAPLEVIEASSDKLGGVIDTEKRTFAFVIDVKSFTGFNSPLQREHFYENYMETSQFRHAKFTGKIIEKIDLNQDGEYSIRSKGKLIIHGVERERIIKSQVTVNDTTMHIVSEFTVLLREYNISVPKIVHQKIAEEIHVRVEANLVQQ